MTHAYRQNLRTGWLWRALALGVLLHMPAVIRPEAAPAGTEPSADAPFTRVITGDIVTIPAMYWPGTWNDYDDDGWLDLFVGASFASKRNYLYHSNRDGTFTLIDDAAMPKVDSNQHGAAWADYDNDGHLDLIVTAGNPEVTHNVLYHNNGNGSFSGITTGPIYTEQFMFGFQQMTALGPRYPRRQNRCGGSQSNAALETKLLGATVLQCGRHLW